MAVSGTMTTSRTATETSSTAIGSKRVASDARHSERAFHDESNADPPVFPAALYQRQLAYALPDPHSFITSHL